MFCYELGGKMSQPKDISQLGENEIIQKKREKILNLRSLNVNPYANDKKPEMSVSDFIRKYKDVPQEVLAETGKEEKHALAGRLMSLRVMGKLAFGHIKETLEKVQVVFSKDFMGEEFDSVKKNFDAGDIVWVKGEAYVTRTGELSLLATEAALLTKNIRPLPEKFHGLTDKETRYRQRYVDLIMNDDVKTTFYKRIKIIAFIRKFMTENGFLEVETPMMHPLVSGAAAKPFITHHNALDMPLYMRIAPELYLKRLLVGGMGKVFEINRSFRNEGMDLTHNPEFTMMEFYWPYADFEDMMNFTEELISSLALEVNGTTECPYDDKMIDFKRPWRRLTIRDSLVEYGAVSSKEDLESVEILLNACKKNGVDISELKNASKYKLMMELFDAVVEHQLIQPTFITEYPSENSPLARKNDLNPEYTDRYELFAAGKELANAFSEQNDPESQFKAFEQQVEAKKAGDDEAVDMDLDFIRALEYGMPPAAGEGIGIDRLVMFVTNSPSIRDVLLFPQMRIEK